MGDIERLRTLLDADPSLANAWSDDGFTPLHFAAFFNQPKAAQLLLDLGHVPVATEAGLPGDRLVAARPGEPVAAGDVTVHPVPALHGVHVTDAYTHGLPGDGDQVRYLGYVLETPAGRLYHAGDTLRWPGQAEQVADLGVEVALLPINGRDPEREARDIVGNLDPGEALTLARDAAVATVVPMHYDLMEGNLGDLDALARLAPTLHPGGRVAVLERMAETPLAALAGR